MKSGSEKKSGQTNATFIRARRRPNDEFYTRLEYINAEVGEYDAGHFHGKTVYCNCDDPTKSKFWHYFYRNFAKLQLRRLMTTCYKNQNPDFFSSHDCERAVHLEYSGGNDSAPDPKFYDKKELRGDGDFRSAECMRLLRQADIVVTNPPFSLFREYVAQLIAEGKKFLIIGNFGAVIYKEIFRLIQAEKLWLGMSPRSMVFDTPNDGEKCVNAAWFTNLSHRKRSEEFLTLTEKYQGNKSAYPKYDNYDAIEVSRVDKIPRGYAGVMGVPPTFLEKWNPDQFELVGLISGGTQGLSGIPSTTGKVGPYINGKLKYSRIFIRNRKPE